MNFTNKIFVQYSHHLKQLKIKNICRFIYRGRIAVFSIKVLRDERVCVIAEQRPDCSEEESFQWMSRVLQAVDSIHQVGIYCLALVPPNHLPKTPLGGIHLCEARRRFLEGSLHPANVLMCPHTCVTNLPKPRSLDQGMIKCVQLFCYITGQIDYFCFTSAPLSLTLMISSSHL